MTGYKEKEGEKVRDRKKAKVKWRVIAEGRQVNKTVR